MAKYDLFVSALVGAAFLFTAPAYADFETVEFTVAGENEPLDAALREASSLLTLTPLNAAPDDVLAAARAEYERLVSALFERGYFGPIVNVTVNGQEAASIPPLQNIPAINSVVVNVIPGPLFHLKDVSLRPLPAGVPSPLVPGALARVSLFQDAVQEGVEAWRARGHAKAKLLSQDITANHKSATVNAALQLDPGPFLRFGAVHLRGLGKMKEARLREILGFPTGAPYSPEQVELAASRLRRTGVFQSVAIKEDDAPNLDGTIDTTITVSEQKVRRVSFSLEVSSLEGVDLRAAWLHRNLFGGGERARIEAKVENIRFDNKRSRDYVLEFSFERPATPNPDTALSVEGSISQSDTLDFNARGFDVSVGFVHIPAPKVTTRVALGYQGLRGTATAGAPLNVTAIILPLQATWNNRDNESDPSSGFFIDLDAKPFIGTRGGIGSGTRFLGDMRAYQTLTTSRRLVLAGRMQIGAVFGSSRVNALRDDLFLIGGGESIRGQAFESLGVTTGSLGDTIIGGRRLVGASVELRGEINRDWGAVLFSDIARVDLDGFFTDAGTWQVGAGVGLRYNTAVGPIRADLAIPLRKGLGTRQPQLYIGLGQAF